MGDKDIDNSNTSWNAGSNYDWRVVHMTGLGTNSYIRAPLGVITGSNSIISGNEDWHNATASVLGSLNSIRSEKYSHYTTGMANSVVGIANIADETNGTLILGAGNKVAHSFIELAPSSSFTGYDYSGYIDRSNNVDTTVGKLLALVQKKEGGGAALVVGSGNEAEYVRQSQVFGTNNTLTGANNSVSLWNSVIGTNNLLTNTSDTLVMGRNRKLSGVNQDIIFGTTEAQSETSVSRAGIYGHGANVYAEGGVALGYGSIADREAIAEDTVPPFSGELYEVNLNGMTDGAVSIGGKVTEQQRRASRAEAADRESDTESGTLRQLINLGDATQDTNAVNLRQLRGGLSFQVISSGDLVGSLDMSEATTAPKFQAGDGLIATISGDAIVFALDTSSDVLNPAIGLKGADGVQGQKGDDSTEKGPKGDTGDTGPQGAQGPQGLKGETGDKGDKGDTGDAGSGGSGGRSVEAAG